jgi:aspartate/methionine/tyrosine aminotransferase
MKNSDYMEWAKTKSGARFSLATSGVKEFPFRELKVRLEDLELRRPPGYVYEPLQRALAEKSGVPSECVVPAMGTSFANHLAMAALLNPGDEVLIEQPVYDPLLSIAQYLRTTVKRFQRRPEQGFRVDIAELERQITPNTKLIVLTNLHNPSSALTDESTLRQIQDLAGKVGARVLVDEVYLEVASVMGKAVRPSFHLGPEFVVTTSLTKAYGLSGVRCGWILAEPEVARKLWQLQDLYYATPPHIAERLSVIALQQLDQISARARSILSNNRVILDRFLDARSDLFVVRPEVASVVFPRVALGRVDELCLLLRQKYETTVVPGRFFEMSDHIRVGIGGEAEELAAGLERLAAALDMM